MEVQVKLPAAIRSKGEVDAKFTVQDAINSVSDAASSILTVSVQLLEDDSHAEKLTAVREALVDAYLRLGGVDYRAMAVSTIAAAERLTMISQDYIARAKDGLVPCASISAIAEVFNSLAHETKELFALHRRGSSANERSRSQRTKPGESHSDRHPVFVDDATGEVALPARTAASYVQPDENEQYDLSVMHASCTHLAAYDEDDTAAVLKNRNRQLRARVRHLDSEVRRLEDHLHRLQDQFSSLYEPLLSANAELEERVRDFERIFCGASQPMTEPVVFRAGEIRDVTTAPVLSRKPFAAQPPLTPSPTRGKRESPKLDAFVSPVASPCTSAGVPEGIAPDMLTHLYDSHFHGRGFNMAWNVLSITFKKEFDSMGLSTAMESFFDAFSTEFTSVATDAHALEARLTQMETPLRAAYVMNCMMAKAKPNSGVMQLLNELPFERDVESFSLGSNLVGDSRMMPLIPLFARMYRLRVLDLSNNGLKNRSVRALCDVLQHHQSITSLDLSGNPISRECGKTLLQLATAIGHLHFIKLDNTQIESALKDRIEHRTEMNRTRES